MQYLTGLTSIYRCLLSVLFVRGGGIDLRFQSKEDRDLWYSTLRRLVTQQRELESEGKGSQ